MLHEFSMKVTENMCSLTRGHLISDSDHNACSQRRKKAGNASTVPLSQTLDYHNIHMHALCVNTQSNFAFNLCSRDSTMPPHNTEPSVSAATHMTSMDQQITVT